MRERVTRSPVCPIPLDSRPWKLHRKSHDQEGRYNMGLGEKTASQWKYAEFRAYHSSWYRICTKAMVISKGSYGHGEFKNVLPLSVQIRYLPVRGRKAPHFMVGSIGPVMEICGSSGLPILMVPRLHKSNGYMKRKLRAWKVQKCITVVGVDTVLTSAVPQSTPFHGR